eukprot:COSAG06_NODE_6571_length_2876_cov_1.645661_5_plen_55_part_00
MPFSYGCFGCVVAALKFCSTSTTPSVALKLKDMCAVGGLVLRRSMARCRTKEHL